VAPVGEFKLDADYSQVIAQMLCESDGTFSLNLTSAADYCNFKAGLSKCRILCHLADNTVWRFFKTDF
jgi:hypothetical protein